MISPSVTILPITASGIQTKEILPYLAFFRNKRIVKLQHLEKHFLFFFGNPLENDSAIWYDTADKISD
jgi:hypothetical protein